MYGDGGGSGGDGGHSKQQEAVEVSIFMLHLLCLFHRAFLKAIV